VEVNYNAGRKIETWQPKAISLYEFPLFPNLKGFASSNLAVMRLIDNIRFIDAKFLQIVDLHQSISTYPHSIIDDAEGGISLKARPTHLGTYKFESEALVFQMRHCIDTLCRLTELLVDNKRVNHRGSFTCDNIGVLFSTQKKVV
jgi:hypothetical protein